MFCHLLPCLQASQAKAGQAQLEEVLKQLQVAEDDKQQLQQELEVQLGRVSDMTGKLKTLDGGATGGWNWESRSGQT
jgi:hypothetical protein